jgi:hypothetical protein
MGEGPNNWVDLNALWLLMRFEEEKSDAGTNHGSLQNCDRLD